MIKIDKLDISNKNKSILTNYQTYLITVKFLNVDTTINSYILDIYKLFSYLKKEYDKITNKDIYEYLKYLETNCLLIESRYNGILAEFDLLIASQFIIYYIGKVLDIDVSKPKYSEVAMKIYFYKGKL